VHWVEHKPFNYTRVKKPKVDCGASKSNNKGVRARGTSLNEIFSLSGVNEILICREILSKKRDHSVKCAEASQKVRAHYLSLHHLTF
jgi:hypothetical protein